MITHIYVPPYDRKDIVIIVATIIVLIILPIIALSVSHTNNFFGQAAGMTTIEAENGTQTGNVTQVVHASASGGKYIKLGSETAGCTISDKLVPSCGALLGVWSKDHGVTGFRNQIEEHESRIGRQVHVAHNYKTQGGTLATEDKHFINRPNTTLFLNYKPSSNFANGGGGNATVNTAIDAMADSIKTVAPKKLILTVWHEPENDVSGGASGCSSSVYKGTAGTPTEYRAMWDNVQSRFEAKGVTNVVWAMTYMGFENWDCMLDDLWPGDDKVDWMIWEPYYGTSQLFESETAKTYNRFMNLSAPGNDYKSKPWGFGEWASWNPSTQPPQPVVYQLYDDARTSINAGKFPNLKMYIYYDVIGPAHDDRLEYTHSGVSDPLEQEHYNELANSPVFNYIYTWPY